MWKETGQSCKLSIQNRDKTMLQVKSRRARRRRRAKTKAKRQKRLTLQRLHANLLVERNQTESNDVRICLYVFCQCFRHFLSGKTSPISWILAFLALHPGQDLDQILAELETPGSKKKAKKGKNWSDTRHDTTFGTESEVSWLNFQQSQGMSRIKARMNATKAQISSASPRWWHGEPWQKRDIELWMSPGWSRYFSMGAECGKAALKRHNCVRLARSAECWPSQVRDVQMISND